MSKIKSYLFDITSINENNFEQLLLGIKKYRRDKISLLSTLRTKYLSLGVEILIRKACEDFGIDYLDEEIVFNEYGKPSFKNSSYYFNTAHSGKYALCVISDSEVGADIEEIKEYKEKVAERMFSEQEKRYIELTNDKEDMFYKLWTLKEAYVKCIGKGFAQPFTSFELTSKDNNIIIKDNLSYQFYDYKFDNYRVAFCVKVDLKDKEKYNHQTTLFQLD